MGGSGLSREKLNAREQVLSSDANRTTALTSRDVQNLLADASTDLGGVPITGLSGPCSLVGIAATFTMTLSAAQALCWNPGDSSLTADDSAYEVARWPQQVLTFGAPSGQPRIDLVVVTPAFVDTDNQARNVLVDPVTRTITSQNVFKTTNPLATVAVVAGTPGATPAPPAVPAGAFALFEVAVPVGVPDATSYAPCPRMFRRAPFPWATASMIVSGFTPLWDLSADPATTSSTISFGALDDSRIVIDGELIEALGIGLQVFQDAGGNNPFAVAAGAVWNKPYYLYAVGGRHAPQAGGAAGATPVVIVESLVAPFPTTGRPSAAITTPRGGTTQAGAVYIGLGFVVAGSTRRAACYIDGDTTYFAQPSLTNLLEHTPTTNAFEAFEVNAPPVVPAISKTVEVFLIGGTAPVILTVTADRGDGGGPMPGLQAGIGNVTARVQGGATGNANARGRVPFNAGAPKFWLKCSDFANAGLCILTFLGFDHQVRRLR